MKHITSPRARPESEAVLGLDALSLSLCYWLSRAVLSRVPLLPSGCTLCCLASEPCPHAVQISLLSHFSSYPASADADELVLTSDAEQKSTRQE